MATSQVETRAADRRAFPRWPYPFDLLFGKAMERRSADPLEIGEGGLSFRTNAELPLGTEINIEFRFGPAQEWILVRCKVCHSDGKKFGVQFLNLHPADRLRIQEFISAGPA